MDPLVGVIIALVGIILVVVGVLTYYWGFVRSMKKELEEHNTRWTMGLRASLLKDDTQQQEHQNEGGEDNAKGGGKEEGAKNYVPPVLPQTAALEARVRVFYQKYCPEKLGSLPQIIEAYKDRVDDLFANLTKKYGPEPRDIRAVRQNWFTTERITARIRRFYTSRQPDKIPGDDLMKKMLEQYHEEEHVLLQKLTDKYGAEEHETEDPYTQTERHLVAMLADHEPNLIDAPSFKDVVKDLAKKWVTKEPQMFRALGKKYNLRDQDLAVYCEEKKFPRAEYEDETLNRIYRMYWWYVPQYLKDAKDDIGDVLQNPEPLLFKLIALHGPEPAVPEESRASTPTSEPPTGEEAPSMAMGTSIPLGNANLASLVPMEAQGTAIEMRSMDGQPDCGKRVLYSLVPNCPECHFPNTPFCSVTGKPHGIGKGSGGPLASPPESFSSSPLLPHRPMRNCKNQQYNIPVPTNLSANEMLESMLPPELRTGGDGAETSVSMHQPDAIVDIPVSGGIPILITIESADPTIPPSNYTANDYFWFTLQQCAKYFAVSKPTVTIVQLDMPHRADVPFPRIEVTANFWKWFEERWSRSVAFQSKPLRFVEVDAVSYPNPADEVALRVDTEGVSKISYITRPLLFVARLHD
eukprot:PhF_6_TR30164/c0_g1_i1/m.44219